MRILRTQSTKLAPVIFLKWRENVEFVHAHHAGRGRHADVVDVGQHVLDHRADPRVAADDQTPADRSRSPAGACRLAATIRSARRMNSPMRDRPRAVAHLDQQPAARAGVVAEELDPAPRLLEQRNELSELGKDPARIRDEGPGELEHDVPPLDPLARPEVAHPMMGQVGADEQKIARPERADMVADEHLAGALGDQVNFVFRVIVPARQSARIVVAMPAERRQPDRRRSARTPDRRAPPSSCRTAPRAIPGVGRRRRPGTAMCRP